jgi:hypothetical protein
LHALRQRVDLGYQYYRADTVISLPVPPWLLVARPSMVTCIYLGVGPSSVSHVERYPHRECPMYLYGNQLPIPVLLGRTLTLTHTYYMVILVFLNLYW